RPRRRDRDHQLRRRLEDVGRAGGHGGPDRDDPPVLRRVREGRSGMTVKVRIPTILRTYTGGAAEVTAEGRTLAEVLDSLEKDYSGIRARVLDENGKLRRFVNVYVGEEDVRFA